MSVIKEKLGSLSGGKILDVGTGAGWFVKLLKENIKDYSQIIGIDIRDDMLKKAKEKFDDDRIKFVNMDATNTTFEDEVMDTVSISNTLHHLPDPKPILEEMKRVLKPGGLFIVQEMFCDNQSEKQNSHVDLHHFEGQIDTLRGICHNKTYKKQEIIDIVTSMGLKAIHTLEHNTHDEQKKYEDLEAEKKNIDWMYNVLKNDKLESIKHLPEYEGYLNRLDELYKQLLKVGFFTATELIIVARK